MLIDSGALDGNYVSEHLASQLRAAGLITQRRQGRVCGAIGGLCSDINDLFHLTLTFKNLNTNVDENINISASVLKMKWPSVIGLPTIREENLVEKLKKHFSKERAEAQSEQTAMRTLPPNDTQCGTPVDKQANMALLTSTSQAVDDEDDEFP